MGNPVLSQKHACVTTAPEVGVFGNLANLAFGTGRS